MGSSVMSGIQTDERDTRLGYAHHVIRGGSCSVLSLDIFDTILFRRVPYPTDLFEVLAAQLRHAGNAPEWLTDTTFRRMRVDAESQARRDNLEYGGEVSLFDIWHNMPLPIFDGCRLEDLVQTELETERAFTVVDLNIAELINAASKNGVPVVLVSDTYFTAEQLAYLLNRPELDALKGMRVFRSVEYGLDKATGLWESVLSELDRTPGQVVHVGDNLKADYTVPAELGIRTVHYRRIDDDFATVLAREVPSPEVAAERGATLDPQRGDFGLTSLRAKALSLAPGAANHAVGVAWRYGATVLGPVLTGFAEWVASRASEAGTPVVWCPMREGEMLSTMVNSAAAVRGWRVEAKPIWLSRQVTAIAVADPYDRDSVRELIETSYQLTVGQLLTMLKLRPGDVPSLASHLHVLLDHGEIVERVSYALTETAYLINRLAGSITATREGLLRSLRTLGALGDPELTLVDLGWGGSIQLKLARILRAEQTGVTVSGLYLATDGRSTRLHCEGLRTEGYLGQAGHPHAIVEALRRSPEVSEQSVSALCGSLVDFTADGSPVLGAFTDSEAQSNERRAVQDGALAFQRQWNRYVAGSGGHWPDLAGEARRQLANILNSALRSPTSDEAGLFGNWRHDDNLGSSVVTRIVPDDLRAAVPYLSPNDLDDLDMRDAFWPALIAASDPQLAALVRAKAGGSLSPEVFEQSGEPVQTHLRIRTGDDEWNDGPRKCVRINHNGLSFARLSFTNPDTSYASIAIPGMPSIVRVDWIEATAHVVGDSEPRTLRWETAEDLAGLTFAESTWLGGNMVQFHAAHAALWLPLAVRAGAPVTSARISVAFAMLPQSRSGLTHRMPPASPVARLAGRVAEEYREKGPTGVAAGVARLAVRRLVGHQ